MELNHSAYSRKQKCADGEENEEHAEEKMK
jgi:hypothetical protein